MLSKWLDHYKEDWPVTELRDSLAEIRSIRHSEKLPFLLPKAEYDVDYVEPKDLLNQNTNKLEYGTVFQITKK